MKRALLSLLLATGLAHAATPTYHTTLDTHHTGDKWKIDSLYIGDKPVLRFHLRENGATWTATSDYAGTFWYGTDGLNSTSVVSKAGAGDGNTYIDITADGTTFASNGTFTCGLTVTNAAGTYAKTWGDGKLVVKKSPGAGSASGLSLQTILPLDQFTITGTLPNANLDADLQTLAAPTSWRLFYSDGTPSLVELALGAAGTVLESGGAGAAPVWGSAGSGDITGVDITAGTGLTGTVSTASGQHTQTLALNAASVASLALADSATQPSDDWTSTVSGTAAATIESGAALGATAVQPGDDWTNTVGGVAANGLAALAANQTFTGENTFTEDVTFDDILTALKTAEEDQVLSMGAVTMAGATVAVYGDNVSTEGVRGRLLLKAGNEIGTVRIRTLNTDRIIVETSGVINVNGNPITNVEDEVYGAAWDGVTEVPTKNAVYDQMEARVEKVGSTLTGGLIFTNVLYDIRTAGEDDSLSFVIKDAPTGPLVSLIGDDVDASAGRIIIDAGFSAGTSGTIALRVAGTPRATVNNDGLELSAALNLGHATDTTIARASAGDVNIEGNIIYRAGGTDVPDGDVADTLTIGAGSTIGAVDGNALTNLLSVIQHTPIELTSAATVTVSEAWSTNTLSLDMAQNVTLEVSNVDTNKHADWVLDVRLNSYTLTFGSSITNLTNADNFGRTNSFQSIVGNRPIYETVTEVW